MCSEPSLPSSEMIAIAADLLPEEVTGGFAIYRRRGYDFSHYKILVTVSEIFMLIVFLPAQTFDSSIQELKICLPSDPSLPALQLCLDMSRSCYWL